MTDRLPEQPIRAFQQDDAGDWVALLACGHTQHMRHRPPFINRPAVLTEAGRRALLGRCLPCVDCARGRADDA